VSTSPDYLLRLRAEREERDRREQSAAQQVQRLRQDREQQRQRDLRDEAARGRLQDDSLARRRSEKQQQASAAGQRRELATRIQGQRRDERRQEAKRSGNLEQQRKGQQERQAETPVTQRNLRTEALRAARADELRRQEQAEMARQEAMARHRDRQSQQREGAEVKARSHAQLRAAKRGELQQQKASSATADQRAEGLRQKQVARQTATRPPLPVRPMARAPLPPARATQVRPSLLPTPPIPEDVPLSWLSTQDSFIVDENGSPVYLRGVTIQGLDTVSPGPNQTLPDALGLDDANLSALEDGWGVNLVRIPFLSRSILHGNAALSANDLVFGLDDVIAEASAAGCYVLLALKPAAGNTGLPSDDDYLCWRALAQRYRYQSAVLYEVFASDSILPANWIGISQAVIGTIRREHTASLLFVGNRYASADVSGFPLKFNTGVSIQNVVYTFRLSPQLLNTVNRPQLQTLGQAYPVFVSEWSDGGTDFGRSAELAAELIERCAIGWAICNWNAEPRLVANAATHQFAPTRWGMLAQRALAQPVKPLLVPF
jgi:hypothetical protein